VTRTEALAAAESLRSGPHRDVLERAHRAFEAGGCAQRAVARVRQDVALAAMGVDQAEVVSLADYRRAPEEVADIAAVEGVLMLRFALEEAAERLADEDVERALMAADDALASFASGVLMVDMERVEALGSPDPSNWTGIWQALELDLLRGVLEQS
jgi:hypothetical protein